MPVNCNNSSVLKYSAVHSLHYKLESDMVIKPETKFSNAVVIPAFSESDYISDSLSSLFAAVLHSPENTQIIVVVNNPPVADCDPLKYRDNHKLLRMLRDKAFDSQKEKILLI